MRVRLAGAQLTASDTVTGEKHSSLFRTSRHRILTTHPPDIEIGVL